MSAPQTDLADRVVLITGAAGGQGAAHAHECARRGARVVLADLDLGAVEVLADELPGSHLAVELDVTREESWDKALAATSSQLGGVDVLVNNAGLYRTCPSTISSAPTWRPPSRSTSSDRSWECSGSCR